MSISTVFGSLPTRVAALAIVIGIGVGAVAIVGVDMTARLYHQEANQRLHRDLADWLVSQYGFVRNGRLDRGGIDSIFGDAMRINPTIEMYLLDDSGGILAFNAPPGRVQLSRVAMEPIAAFLAAGAHLPILGTDPRHPEARQVFSVAPIRVDGQLVGYLYVVVGGELYQTWVTRLRSSHILRSAATVAGSAALAGAVAGLLGFWVLTRRISRLADALRDFKQSGFTEQPRIPNRRGVALGRDEIDRLQDGFAELVELVCRQVRQLRTADTQLRESIASVSHDLRTPLTALGGYLDTVLMKNETLPAEERRRFLQLAVAQYRRLARLVRAQFELTLLESSSAAFNPQPSSLSDLVNDIGQKFQETAKSADVSLSVDMPLSNIQANIDVGLIERVLENLIGNAIRHTPAKGRVVVTLRPEETRIRVIVEDTGSGVPVEQQPFIFQWPSRGGKTARASGEGAGLGLAIARRIVELHGGHIGMESQFGVGSKFQFDLPAWGVSKCEKPLDEGLGNIV